MAKEKVLKPRTQAQFRKDLAENNPNIVRNKLLYSLVGAETGDLQARETELVRGAFYRTVAASYDWVVLWSTEHLGGATSTEGGEINQYLTSALGVGVTFDPIWITHPDRHSLTGKRYKLFPRSWFRELPEYLTLGFARNFFVSSYFVLGYHRGIGDLDSVLGIVHRRYSPRGELTETLNFSGARWVPLNEARFVIIACIPGHRREVCLSGDIVRVQPLLPNDIYAGAIGVVDSIEYSEGIWNTVIKVPQAGAAFGKQVKRSYSQIYLEVLWRSNLQRLAKSSVLCERPEVSTKALVSNDGVREIVLNPDE